MILLNHWSTIFLALMGPTGVLGVVLLLSILFPAISLWVWSIAAWLVGFGIAAICLQDNGNGIWIDIYAYTFPAGLTLIYCGPQ